MPAGRPISFAFAIVYEGSAILSLPVTSACEDGTPLKSAVVNAWRRTLPAVPLSSQLASTYSGPVYFTQTLMALKPSSSTSCWTLTSVWSLAEAE